MESKTLKEISVHLNLNTNTEKDGN